MRVVELPPVLLTGESAPWMVVVICACVPGTRCAVLGIQAPRTPTRGQPLRGRVENLMDNKNPLPTGLHTLCPPLRV